MNLAKRSIRIVLIGLALIVLMGACRGGTEVQAILPPESEKVQTSDSRTATPTIAIEQTTANEFEAADASEISATSSRATATLVTLAESAVDAVTWNPETEPLRLEPVTNGLTKPLFVTHAKDDSGRVFVVEQPGRIRIVQDGQLLETPFLDISDRVNDGRNEQGLLGLAFPPNYSESGAFYVNYTDAAGDTIVERYEVSTTEPNIANVNSQSLILQVDQPASNHNGGMLAFGPDEYLYVGLGDGGAANDRFDNGQNPASLLGKMLRIDVLNHDGDIDADESYRIPVDNPWVGIDWNGQDVRDEIWAVGLRNPWRYSFDRETGDLWIGDVGQNQWEEINQIPIGHTEPINFGWPIQEGNYCFQSDDCNRTGLWQPITDYDHGSGCSVTGGYVYRGEEYPSMQGTYIYGDYCSGRIWAITADGNGIDDSREVLDTDLFISSFGEDEQGELYITDSASGTIYRLTLDGE